LALSAQDKWIERHLTLQEWMEIKPMNTSPTNTKGRIFGQCEL
jgi:hypothetical protein